MPNETFPIRLGGREWRLRQLPLRGVMKVEHKLLRCGQSIFPAESDGRGIHYRVDEAILETLSDVAFSAIAVVGPDLTREAFFELPITSMELLLSMTPLLRAVGIAVAETGEPPQSGRAASPIASAASAGG